MTPPGASTSGLTIRPFAAEDLPQVLTLLERSLGWLPDAEHERFFRWKHQESPFGASPAWVADDGGRVAGFRTFMRWEFRSGDVVHRAVRAVDTATHPDYRGRGIFSALTLHALDSLAAEGVSFVFNTPNEQSRPGYLKMGWQTVGRVSVRLRPRGVTGLFAAARARVPADLWSIPTAAGAPAPAVLSDPAVERLLAERSTEDHGTHRTLPYLAWRYGFPALAYRAVALGDEPERGLAVFRMRRRGRAVEAAVCETITPNASRRTARALVRRVVRESGADYAVVLADSVGTTPDLVPVPGLGPVLTYRALASRREPPSLREWRLSLGDIELM